LRTPRRRRNLTTALAEHVGSFVALNGSWPGSEADNLSHPYGNDRGSPWKAAKWAFGPRLIYNPELAKKIVETGAG
jgi:hypothetical protein